MRPLSIEKEGIRYIEFRLTVEMRRTTTYGRMFFSRQVYQMSGQWIGVLIRLCNAEEDGKDIRDRYEGVKESK